MKRMRVWINSFCFHNDNDEDVKLRLDSFNSFVSFNFGQIQLLRFVVVMVWSNLFGHLDLVK